MKPENHWFGELPLVFLTGPKVGGPRWVIVLLGALIPATMVT